MATSRRSARGLSLLAGAVLAWGCGGDLPERDLAEWAAELHPVADFPVAGGRAFAHVREGQTRVTIEFHGGAPGVEHGWRLAHGPCAEPGAPLPAEEGDLLGVQMDEQGRGGASATLTEALMPGQRYHVLVHWTEEDPDPVLACGEILQR